MKTKIQLLLWCLLLLTFLRLALADVGAAMVEQSGENPIVFDQVATTDNLVVLMAAGAAHNEELTVVNPNQPPKHFYINNFDDTDDVFEWTVALDAAADYHVDGYLSAAEGETFRLSVVETGETLDYSTAISGWEKHEAGIISLPAGTSTLRLVRTSTAANVSIKSLELIRESDRADYLQRIADFKVDNTWFSQSGYGVMFQYGAWGWPVSGDKKSLEDQANDFDVPAFVEMVKGTGASYVIWSTSWVSFIMNAPIASVDAYFGHGDQTSTRDLYGDIMTALDAEGIDFMFYYHRGEANAVPWFQDPSYPHTEFGTRGTGDRSLFFDSWETIITEMGNRYGDKLDGWVFDTGHAYYPAPYERLGAAARAGNPNRLFSFNSHHWGRTTEFQDFYFGENHTGLPITGSAGEGGDGILTAGPNKGLLEHGMLHMEYRWGITKKNETASTIISKATALNYMASASPRNVPLSFNMVMWEDGTVNQTSLDVLNAVKFGGEVDLQVTPTSGSSPLTVSFDASGSTSLDGIASYNWDFGDGNSATGVTATNTYMSEGTYTATLTVTNESNESVNASVSIYVFEEQIPGLDLSVNTFQSSTPPSISTTDLAQTQFLSSSAASDNEVATEHAELFNGSVGNDDTNITDPGEVKIDPGDTFTVMLDTSVNTNGYDITGIDSVFGWNTKSGGRANQGYAILVTYVDDTMATLASPGYWEPNDPVSYWTKVSFTELSGGVMASGVKAITFHITEEASPGGFVVGREVDIFGVPTGTTVIDPADVSIALVGDGTGYDATTAQAAAWRSTSVDKGALAIEVDDAFGASGSWFAGNGTDSDLSPTWATNFTDLGAQQSGHDAYEDFDDPTEAIAPTVSDWTTTAFIIGDTAANWSDLLSFNITDLSPGSFRVGVMAGNNHLTDGRFDPAALRLSFEGGIPVAATDLGMDGLGMVFWDVSVSEGTTGTFLIEGLGRTEGVTGSNQKGASIAGVTFDLIPAGFDAWSINYPTLTDTSFDGDPDLDGFATGLEYVLNGDPTQNGDAILPELDAAGENFVFTFTRLALSAADTMQVFQYSSTLQADDWTDLSITDPQAIEVSVGTEVDGLQTVTVTISKTVATNEKLFGRLKVSLEE